MRVRPASLIGFQAWCTEIERKMPMLVASGMYIGIALASTLRVALRNQSVAAAKSGRTRYV